MSFTNNHKPRAHVNSRSRTLPSFMNHSDDMLYTDLSNPTPANYPLPPSIKESLEEWLYKSTLGNTNSPVSYLETCGCCGQTDCENLDTLNKTIKKLESDTRLAAEIGQSLLQKHETYVIEATHVTESLQSQLDVCHENVARLEQSLEETENSKQELLHESKKAAWEHQKAQKILKETMSDLEISNAKCAQLAKDLEMKCNEVEKLRVFKFMVRQSDIREESLRSKLEDMNQELAVTRKSELMLESKQKKLMIKFEAMSIAYDRMRGREDLRDNCRDTKIAPVINSITPEMQQSNMNHLLDLVKELASANSKFKTELMDCKSQLNDAHLEAATYNNKMYGIDKDEEMPRFMEITASSIYTDNLDFLSRSAPSLPILRANGGRIAKPLEVKLVEQPILGKQAQPQRDSRHPFHAMSIKERSLASKKGKDTARPKTGPNPKPSVSSPAGSIIHHHYHYHGRQNKNETLVKEKAASLGGPNDAENSPSRTPSFVESSKRKSVQDMDQLTTTELLAPQQPLDGSESKSPYSQLQEHVSQTLQRLVATDIRALNRRLRRTFDIFELSSMSNSIIENILTDVGALSSRFIWVQDEISYNHNESLNAFFPILRLFQDLLQEMGQLRSTMNELQVEYVKKVEEYGQKVEEEIVQKREKLKSETMPTNMSQSSSGPLAWFAQVFQKATHHPTDRVSKTIPRSISCESIPPQYPHEQNNFVGRAFGASATYSSLQDDHNDSYHSRPSSTMEKERQGMDIRRVKSSTSRYGPASSYPRSSPLTAEKLSHRVPYPVIRASQSTGTDRKAKARQVPSLGRDVGQRQKSPLRLTPAGVSGINYDGTVPQTSASERVSDWKVGGHFSTSWLGSN
ncbi:hypothetical protein CLU79DRAFT_25229 [Phycomyces nitens]|nr:hypothetical protein CLU79DRAFT_25229 [Phycomyces nitens]